jgi:hypothetical protein
VPDSVEKAGTQALVAANPPLVTGESVNLGKSACRLAIRGHAEVLREPTSASSRGLSAHSPGSSSASSGRPPVAK